MSTDVAHWSAVAQDWIAWARTEDFDAFWAYQSTFEAFVGPGQGPALEIGCGEGRVARTLGTLGYEMTVAEPVPAFLDAAQAANSATHYVQAEGHDVPLGDARFDLVVLYNVLMDVDDLAGTLSEAARVLRPQGRLIASVVHPIAERHYTTLKHGDPGSYFETQYWENQITERDLPMHFRGWRRSISTYFQALFAVDLQVTDLAEPQPDPHHPWTARAGQWQGVPLFLWIEARKVPVPTKRAVP